MEPVYDAFIVFENDQCKVADKYYQEEARNQFDLFIASTMKYITEAIAEWRLRFAHNPRTEEFIQLLKDDYMREIEQARKLLLDKDCSEPIQETWSSYNPGDAAARIEQYLDRWEEFDDQLEYPHPTLIQDSKREWKHRFAKMMDAIHKNTLTLETGEGEYTRLAW